jgi:serine/threonine-protein kinase
MVLRSDGSPPRPAARSAADAGAVAFAYLAEIAVGTTTRVDLCRILDGPRAGQLCAVKRLHAHIAEDPSIATQFVDEVWMTAALRHPNVVEVAGWGEDAQGTYLAVELVQGVSLARLMKTVFETGEVFSERMVVYIGTQLCRGLAAAHALRGPDGELLHLVHRDLSPGNVLASFDGQIKIADFGLAKAKQRLTRTITGLLKGQPAYMSPEQARGRDVDLRSDVFSLGVVLFELFSGRRPWAPATEIDAVQTMLTEPPADLRELRPKIDRELVAIVGKCLEREPGARFQSAGEIQQRLEAWLGVHGYSDGNEEALARFVRRNAMRQMRWFERAVAGELVPSSGGSAPPPPAPPPTNTSSSNQPLLRAPRSPIARPRPAPSGMTGVTDVDPRPPVSTPAGAAPQGRGTIDWGEELPTLVQSQSAKGAKPGRLPVAYPRDIHEEESDGRTTAVKRPSQVVQSMLGHGLPRITSAFADGDSEELPTLPIDAKTRDDLRNALRAARAGSSPEVRAPRPPLAEPPSEETQPREDRGPVAARPSELTLSVLEAEVERLSREAKRLGEEAREAASAAARAEAVSRMATEAAVMANDALRLASTAGLASAGERLDQALALEEAARRGDLRIVEVAPPAARAVRASMPEGAPPSVAPHAAPVVGPPPAPPPPSYAPPPAFATPPPSAAFPSAPAPPSFDPRPRWAATSSQEGAIPASAYETVPRRAVPIDLAAAAKFGTNDALAFQAQMKPMLWGMPLPLALAFGAGILALGLLVLWLLLT